MGPAGARGSWLGATWRPTDGRRLGTARLGMAETASPLCPTGEYISQIERTQREAVLAAHLRLISRMDRDADDLRIFRDAPPRGLDWWAYEDSAWPKPKFCARAASTESDVAPPWDSEPPSPPGVVPEHSPVREGCNAQFVLRGQRVLVQSARKCATTALDEWSKCVARERSAGKVSRNDGCAATRSAPLDAPDDWRVALAVREPISRLISAYEEIAWLNLGATFMGDAERGRNGTVGCEWASLDHAWTWRRHPPPRPRPDPAQPSTSSRRSCEYPCWCRGFADGKGRPRNVSALDGAACGDGGWMWSGTRVVPADGVRAADFDFDASASAARSSERCDGDGSAGWATRSERRAGVTRRGNSAAATRNGGPSGARRIVDPHERFRAFVYATACARRYAHSAHTIGVSTFARAVRVSVPGRAPSIAHLARIESLRTDLERGVLATTTLARSRCNRELSTRRDLGATSARPRRDLEHISA